jgi:succinate dehydrogenase flavin-adding protein (antitoxin of CptAB toxin-antitoxin module)
MKSTKQQKIIFEELFFSDDNIFYWCNDKHYTEKYNLEEVFAIIDGIINSKSL